MPGKKGNLEERFWEKVDKSPGLGPNGECWFWRGVTAGAGYGVIGLGSRKLGKEYAHRVIWVLMNGPIPEGLFVLHTCDEPLCVNPKHLWLGTPKDNVRDMLKKGRGRAGGPPGEKHGMSKLTDEKVRWLRWFYEDGWSQDQIANMLGVSQNTVSRAIRSECWKHVD